MNKTLFSIITIAYNSERTIERTIQSVLNQTFNNYEYIIVDGNSKDGTLDIVKKYEPLFEGRMKWQSEPDHGIYNAMNKGIKMATGDIVGIVNSDDWLDSDALKTIAFYASTNIVNKNDSFIITGWMNYHYNNGNTVVLKSSYNRYVKYAKRMRMGLNHPATFVSLQTYKTVGLFDENFRLFGDADFIYRCYLSNVNVFFINRVLSNMSDGGASSRVSKYSLIDSKYRIKKYQKGIRRVYLYIKLYLNNFLQRYTPQGIVEFARKYRNK